MGQWACGSGSCAGGPFWRVYLLIPPLPRSIGIINLGEIRDLIYGLQSLRGKILSRKELQSEIGSRWSVPVSRMGISRSRLSEHGWRGSSVENARFERYLRDDERNRDITSVGTKSRFLRHLAGRGGRPSTRINAIYVMNISGKPRITTSNGFPRQAGDKTTKKNRKWSKTSAHNAAQNVGRRACDQ